MTWTTKEVATLTGLTPRTLRHYDAIGLVCPSRAENDYRVYTQSNIERLQDVMFYKELGFSLHEIASILDDPNYNKLDALLKLRLALTERKQHINTILQTLNQTIQAHQQGVTMESKDMFNGFDASLHEEETQHAWGHTSAYKESSRRTQKYTPEDWQKIQQEHATLYDAFNTLKQNNTPPDDPRATRLALQHRELISNYFYTCTPEIHQGLALIYVQDERFQKNINTHGEELATYISQAITHLYQQTPK